ncbi:head protein [Massilia sp. KIM]|uniref:Mu-like prophage major head subunit gpT family protein n=1 Tax=Massilia sp. KIM TaxID=1955422 RepID=UPI00098F78A3|nr:Mu-like prophage major head subunit gpT family protein [Massilia sp. KIM]OON62288.1 head protein [Massilia sp. KIM]
MLVNRETITNLFVSLKTTYNNAFAASKGDWEQIAMKVPSTTGQNDYAWLSKFPRMRQWIGEKTVKALSAFKYVIVNNDFEATVEVDRNDIEDDNIGIYQPQATAAGDSAAQLPDEIIADVVNAGFTTVCYDGQYFFDTDHPGKDENGNDVSISNKGTKKLSAASYQAALDSLGAAETAMMEFKDDEGRPLNIKPTVLMVPPALKAVANTLMTADRLEDGKPNPFKGAYVVRVDARLKSRTAWFLLDTTKPVKPFVYQERKAPVFVQQVDPQSDDVFSRKKYKFGAEARAAGGYGFWQLAYGSDGTVA